MKKALIVISIGVSAVAITTYTARLYIRVYRRYYGGFEFVPTNENRNILVRHFVNKAKFTYALWRYRVMTVGGYFPPNVQYYSALMEKSITRTKDLRPIFVPSGDNIDVFPCHSIHSHPRSAEIRTASNHFLVELVKKAGYTPYVVSSSRQDKGDGNRYFYCCKDFGIVFKDDAITENTALVFTDVDYYADMTRWLNLWKPICMYTLVPETLNYNNDEFCYRFNGDELHYNVSGGGEYKHKLWDYRGDVLTTVDFDGSLLTFDVEQRKIKGDDQHRLIWLLPKAKIADPLWIAVYSDWQLLLLHRKQVKNGKLLTLWEPISDSLSIGVDGSNYSVKLPGKLYEAIKVRLKFKDSAPFVSDVERMLKEAKHVTYAQDAPILYSCFGEDIIIRPNVIKTGHFPVMYHAIPKRGGLSTEDPKSPGQTTTTPLVSQPALFAAKGHNPDRACIEGRIDKVKNLVRFPPKYRSYATEFVDLLIPSSKIGVGVPLSAGEVRESQDKKAQRGRFDRVAPLMSLNVENKIKSFIKTETYSSAKAPRNISTMSPEITIQSSGFSLVMASELKKLPWYCPGMTPRRIVERLSEVIRMSDNDIEEGDYTCLDGSQSPDYSNLLLLPMYMRYFAPEHRGEFKRLYKQIYKEKATTTTGIAYNPRMTVRSGSAITTQAGTIDNAFNIYAALRNMGRDKEDAWSNIGAVFGDDSVNSNHEGQFHSFIAGVASDLGMIYKSNIRKREDPVLFLGRYFVDPTTIYDSFADPMRTIGKLHTSGNNAVTPEQGAANKAWGYESTDRLTPIIGTWAARVLAITKLKFKGATSEEQYRCSNAWPQRDKAAITEAMAKVLGIPVTELLQRDEIVKDVNRLDHFPVLFDTGYEHKQEAVVDGELVGTDAHQENKQQNEQQPEASNTGTQQTCVQATASITNPSERSANRSSRGNRTTTKCGSSRGRDAKRVPPTDKGGRRGTKPPSRGRQRRLII